MKGFGIFDTTNTLYGSFYSRSQDPITNIPKYSKPNMEEQFYERTLEMQKNYFNRYAHLYEDPTGKSIYNPIDGKAFKEENTPGPIQHPGQGEEQENIPIQKPEELNNEMPQKESGEEPVMRTFHRNFESEQK